MDNIVLVSADGHAAGRPEAYKEYLPASLADQLEEEQQNEDAKIAYQRSISPTTLEVIDDRHLLRDHVADDSVWDADRRLKALDAEGVAAELVIYGTSEGVMPFFSVRNKPYPPDVRAAGVRAYHRALADSLLAPSKGRLLGAAQPGPCLDMDATVEELKWVAEHGFVTVTIPGEVIDPALPPPYDPYYEPFWSACADLGLKLLIHAGWGVPQGQLFEAFKKLGSLTGYSDDPTNQEERLAASAMMSGGKSVFALSNNVQRVMWQMMLGGVFDRHPDLMLVPTEVRADWVPGTLAYLDKRFEEINAPVKLKPSEYFARNCAVAPSSPRAHEIAMRHEIGLDLLMFGTDYPHPESTWPNTKEWIRATFKDVPLDEARKVLGENAIRIYGFDKKVLEKVAARIGPAPEDVLGDFHVDERLLANFDLRSGFLKPAQPLDIPDIDFKLSEDFAGVGASA
jgi:predicted TIM-barrel fold metal-dependent hydrolase